MRSRTLFAILLCVSGLPTVVQATERPEASVQFGLQNFSWSEFDYTGAKLLKENGPRFAIGAALDNFQHAGSGVLYGVNVKIYLGVVDYDGQTQSGVSAQTDVDYFGVNAEVMGGLRLTGGLHVDLLGGLGVDTWTRELQDGVTANGTVALGYREDLFHSLRQAGAGVSVSE